MPDIQVSEKLVSFLTFLPMFFLSITFHEYAHAFVAYKMGDSTAKNMGRLTLNPIKHADFFGTLIMPIASFATGIALIGWAKPVPIDRRNFKNAYKDDAYVSFAGPFANLLLALLTACLSSKEEEESSNFSGIAFNCSASIPLYVIFAIFTL